MKRFTGLLVLILLVGLVPETWAGPAEEIAEIGRQRTKAFVEGNLDAYTAAFADNAVATFSLTPFRVEGHCPLPASAIPRRPLRHHGVAGNGLPPPDATGPKAPLDLNEGAGARSGGGGRRGAPALDDELDARRGQAERRRDDGLGAESRLGLRAHAWLLLPTLALGALPHGEYVLLYVAIAPARDDPRGAREVADWRGAAAAGPVARCARLSGASSHCRDSAERPGPIHWRDFTPE